MCFTTFVVTSVIGQELVQPVMVKGDNVKALLFKEANTSMNKAKFVNADILAPNNFGEGLKLYKEAEKNFKQEEELDEIRKDLSESVKYFNKAIESTKLAEVTFPNAIKARRDARNTGASLSTDRWKDAESKFKEATMELEDGNVDDARDESAAAEKLYRKAELEAIKTNFLTETKVLLKKADEMDVEDNAPKTLALAKQLIKQAEKELNENRYDTDVARGLAKQAKYEAKHAIYLAKTIEQMKDKDKSWEDLILVSEMPLQQISEKTGRVAYFDEGMGKTTAEISKYINTYQDSVNHLIQVLDWYDDERHLHQDLIAELELQAGTQATEKSALAMQLAAQAKTREIFNNLEQSFQSDEARVLREGNNIIIRLVGLNFPSAKSTIEQKSFGLLTKVRDAINSFPESSVSVLGYTDSYGGDMQNLQLSKERAEAVKEYLIANSKLLVSEIEVIGYGETKPIATNETVTGRTANRRVDVVIHPYTGIKLVLEK
jgi:outer membrane protein OmpA-like peptidoglycan-associated protein